MFDVQHRARRRRVEGGLVLSLALALTVIGAGLYVLKLATLAANAGALFGPVG